MKRWRHISIDLRLDSHGASLYIVAMSQLRPENGSLPSVASGCRPPVFLRRPNSWASSTAQCPWSLSS